MWREDELEIQNAVEIMVGKPISRAETIVFEHGRDVDHDDYAVQLTAGECVLLLWGSGDGETLRVRTTRWRDPFEGPLPPENRDFVVRSGKWTARDASRGSPLEAAVGKLMLGANPVRNVDERLRGMYIQLEGGLVLLYVIAGDQGYLTSEEELSSLELRVDR